MTASSDLPQRRAPLGLFRCALTGAVVLVVLFVVCWVGALVASAQSHMFIQIFTVQPVTSTAALVDGLIWSVVFGGLSGLLLALAYNGLAFLERR